MRRARRAGAGRGINGKGGRGRNGRQCRHDSVSVTTS
jgi:hypothetical protein